VADFFVHIKFGIAQIKISIVYLKFNEKIRFDEFLNIAQKRTPAFQNSIITKKIEP
jgi:hypothetical protein